MNWTDDVHWTVKFMKGRSSIALVYKMTMASTVYCICLEHNSRIFQQKQQGVRSLVRRIIQEIHERGNRHSRVASY